MRLIRAIPTSIPRAGPFFISQRIRGTPGSVIEPNERELPGPRPIPRPCVLPARNESAERQRERFARRTAPCYEPSSSSSSSLCNRGRCARTTSFQSGS